MRAADNLMQVGRLNSPEEEMGVIAGHIRRKAAGCRTTLEILEAGCGKRWGIDLEGVKYTLTGVDSNGDALELRKNGQRDLQVAVLGDLRTVQLEKGRYDVIYNSNVLEHVDGAEEVLDNFVRWLKPGGMLVLIMPNRDSAKGFLTRVLPFGFHVFYKRHVQGWKDAGLPGCDPFPTYFDGVVSRKGIREYCRKHGLVIRAEYSTEDGGGRNPAFRMLSSVLIRLLNIASFGRLSAEDANMVFIIEADG